MSLNRVLVAWDGTGVVGPGLSTFYYAGAMTGNPAALSTFFNAIKSVIPAGLTITVPSSGDVLDESTGELTGAWSQSGGSTIATTGTANFAQGVGARCVWNTANVHLGRRVRGSTFIVPLVSSAYDSGGLVGTTVVSTLQTAADALVTSTTSTWRIWSRPNDVGSFAVSAVTSATAPRKVSTLRSRRV